MKAIFAGDKHLNEDEGFYEANKKYFEWFLSQPFNSEENLYIDLGDFFNFSEPSPRENDLAFWFFREMKIKTRILLGGNHCYNRKKQEYSIRPLGNLPGTIIVTKPQILRVCGLVILCLPFIYDYQDEILRIDGRVRTMRELYSSKELLEKVLGEPLDQPIDIVIYHFEDQTQSFGPGKQGIDISYLAASSKHVVGGHIHIKSSGYLGVPFPTRKDERGQQGRILVYDPENHSKDFITVPKFADFSVVKYGDPAPQNPEGAMGLYIFDAPSYGQAQEKYRESWVREVELEPLEIEKLAFKSENGDNAVDADERTKYDKAQDEKMFREFVENRRLDSRVVSVLEGVLFKAQTISTDAPKMV